MSLYTRMSLAVDEGRASALELALMDFALRQGSSPAVALALAACQRATAEGHSCLDLADKLPAIAGESSPCDAAQWQQELEGSDLVSTADKPITPLVRDGQRLYLQRYWAYENRLAAGLNRLLQEPPAAVDLSQLEHAGLDTHNAKQTTNWQAVAAVAALRHRFAVISGGPGTGKTYTILRLLAVLIEQALNRGQTAPLVRLAAPTGKAAARMLEAIKAGLPDLPVSDSTKAAIPMEAQTLHRLLGLGFRSTAARYDANNPLAADLVIVDEASMVDLPMMAKLVDALAPSTRLILLGDRYQLASVEAGSVLAELCQAAGLNRMSGAQASIAKDLLQQTPEEALCPLSDHVVTLQTSRRFSADSGIGRLASSINRGDAEQSLQQLANDPATRLVALPDQAALHALVQTLAEHFRQLHHAHDAATALNILQQQAVLCAIRRGRFGSQGLNQAITAELAQIEGFDARQTWYHGRPVIISRNDYQAGLYNGDTGVCLRDNNGQLRVWFDTEQGLRSFLPSALPSHDSVYAMTVHKSQGSEYDHVSLILPRDDNRVLSQELIYTAITRARKSVCIYGDAAVLAGGTGRQIRRYSGLAQHLAG